MSSQALRYHYNSEVEAPYTRFKVFKLTEKLKMKMDVVDNFERVKFGHTVTDAKFVKLGKLYVLIEELA